MNDPQAPLVYSTNVGDMRDPRLAGRVIFFTLQPWMGQVSTSELAKMKVESNELARFVKFKKTLL